MELTIYSPSGAEIYTMPEIFEGCVEKAELMSEDSIELHFSLAEPANFPVGSHCDWNGKRYEVTDAQSPSYNVSTGGYDYTLKLEAYYMAWKQRLYKYIPEEEGVGNTETSFSFTSALAEHARLICRCLNADGYTFNGAEITYKVNRADGDGLDESKSISYSGETYIDALNRIADEWDTEWWVVDGVINFGKCETGDAVDFQIGKNVVTMSGSKGSGEYANRLYAFGSDRNLPNNYGKGDAVFTVAQIATSNGLTFVKTDNKLKIEFFRKKLRNKSFGEAVAMTLAESESEGGGYAYDVLNVLAYTGGSYSTASTDAEAEAVSDDADTTEDTTTSTTKSVTGTATNTSSSEITGGSGNITGSTTIGGSGTLIDGSVPSGGGGTSSGSTDSSSGTGTDSSTDSTGTISGSTTIGGTTVKGYGYGSSQLIKITAHPLTGDYWWRWCPKGFYHTDDLVCGDNKIILPKDRKKVYALMRCGHTLKTSTELMSVSGKVTVYLQTIIRTKSSTVKQTIKDPSGAVDKDIEVENYHEYGVQKFGIDIDAKVGQFGTSDMKYYCLGYAEIPEFELKTDDNVAVEHRFVVLNGTKTMLSFGFGFMEAGDTDTAGQVIDVGTYTGSLYLSTRDRYENATVTLKYLSGKYKNTLQTVLLYTGYRVDGLDSFMWMRMTDTARLPSVGDTFYFTDIINGAMPSYYFPYSLENLKVIKAIAETRLALPAPYRIDARDDLQDCEIVESIYEDEDIYPRTEAEIVDVQSKEFYVEDGDGNLTDEKYPSYYIKTDKYEFDSEYQLDNGENMQIVFQTGALAGLTFDCYFNSGDIDVIDKTGVRDGQYFKILRGQFDGGLMLPNTAMRPRSAADYEKDGDTTHYIDGKWVGDKFILTGWNPEYLPDLKLIENAQEELRQAAEKHLADISEDPTTYECTLFPDTAYGLSGSERVLAKPASIGTALAPDFGLTKITDTEEYLLTDGDNGTLDHDNAKVYDIGQRVTLINRAFFADGSRVSRILGYERKMDIPWDSPTYSVGKKAVYSRFAKIEAEVEKQERKDDGYSQRTLADPKERDANDTSVFEFTEDRVEDCLQVAGTYLVLYVPRTGYNVKFVFTRNAWEITLPFMRGATLSLSLMGKTFNLTNASDFDINIRYPKKDGAMGTYTLAKGASATFTARNTLKPNLWLYYTITK